MERVIDIVSPAILESIYMVFISSAIAIFFGMILGIILTVTRPGGLVEKKTTYSVLDFIINIMRSLPFIILMVVVYPLTKLIVGKGYGTNAAIVPLAISAAPFFARLVEGYLTEVNRGVIEAAKSMGSSNAQIVFKVLIPEAMPSIINGITLTIINLIGYSAMAGTIGGGGLGDVAMRYGYQRRESSILWVAVLAIIVIVQLVQFIGNKISVNINKK